MHPLQRRNVLHRVRRNCDLDVHRLYCWGVLHRCWNASIICVPNVHRLRRWPKDLHFLHHHNQPGMHLVHKWNRLHYRNQPTHLLSLQHLHHWPVAHHRLRRLVQYGLHPLSDWILLSQHNLQHRHRLRPQLLLPRQRSNRILLHRLHRRQLHWHRLQQHGQYGVLPLQHWGVVLHCVQRRLLHHVQCLRLGPVYRLLMHHYSECGLSDLPCGKLLRQPGDGCYRHLHRWNRLLSLGCHRQGDLCRLWRRNVSQHSVFYDGQHRLHALRRGDELFYGIKRRQLYHLWNV